MSARSARPIWLGEDSRGWDHFRVHLDVLRQADMGVYEFAAYCALVAHAEVATGESHPSARTIAAYFGASDRRMRQAVWWLEEHGWIKVERVDGAASRYYVLPPPTPAPRADLRDATPAPGAGEGGTTCRGTPAPHAGAIEQEPSNKNQELRARAAPAQDALPIADEALQQFELFWQAYPTRDGKKIGKGKALEFWRRMDLDRRRAAWRGAVNLARGVAEGGRFGVQDPERFLRTERYRDWQDPATVEPDPANRVQNAFDVIDRVAAQRKETNGTGRRPGTLEVPSRQLPPGPR